jgi:hypothetical protein
MRTFGTGATRDTAEGKLDFDGFFNPLVLERYAEYMDEHRLQADGNLRDSDNWQEGMPRSVYRKSLWRHFFDVWKLLLGMSVVDRITGKPIYIEDALCALLFNTMGVMLEILLDRDIQVKDESTDSV